MCSPFPSALQFIKQSDDLTSASTAQGVPQCYCSSQGVDLLHGNAQLFHTVHSLGRPREWVHGDALISTVGELRGLQGRLVISSVRKAGQQTIPGSFRAFTRLVLKRNLAQMTFVITQTPPHGASCPLTVRTQQPDSSQTPLPRGMWRNSATKRSTQECAKPLSSPSTRALHFPPGGTQACGGPCSDVSTVH